MRALTGCDAARLKTGACGQKIQNTHHQGHHMLERVGPNSRPSLRKRPSSPRRQESEAVACMAGGIAHDLNNLFMIVSGNVDLLRYEVQSEKAGRLLDTIARMTQRPRAECSE